MLGTKCCVNYESPRSDDVVATAAAAATAMPIPASVISTGPRFQRSSLPSSSRAAEATKST